MFIEEYEHIKNYALEYLNYDKLILPSHYHDSLILHNTGHARRVLIHSLILASMKRLTDYERGILCEAAVYHDIGRMNDSVDSSHGLRSWRKYILKVCADKALDEKKEAVRFLIINHCFEQKDIGKFDSVSIINTYKHLLFLLKDADALDRVRNKKLDIRYLQSEESLSLVPFASILYDNEQEVHNYITQAANIIAIAN